MKPTLAVRLTLLVMAAVTVVGAVDAGIGGSWDLLVLFAALFVMIVALLLGSTVRRPLIPIRADLHRWLTATAAVNGERAEHLADRAISSYRARLFGELGPKTDDEC